MTSLTGKCVNCSRPLSNIELSTGQRVACYLCGSTKRSYSETLVDSASIYDSLRGRLKRPSFPSKKKLRGESFIGFEFSHKLQKMVHKIRDFDRDTDKYIERITDIQSGEIIHECIEPLSEHIGHGTPKKKQS